MRILIRRVTSLLPVLFLLIWAGQTFADDVHGEAHKEPKHMEHTPASPAMHHMSHAEMINSERDFLREMIPHHQEAVDTSILLYVSTDDPDLRMLTKTIYQAQTEEILDMRISYARYYSRIPREFMYQSMMRDLNIVRGKERDIRYVQDMIMHHKGALEMAEKVLTFKDIHEETAVFAKEIIKNQKTEIDVMENWLRNNMSSQ